DDGTATASPVNRLAGGEPTHVEMPGDHVPAPSRLESAPAVKSVFSVESEAPPQGAPAAEAPDTPPLAEPAPRRDLSARGSLAELWEQELRSARRKLEPEGALTGATRELQAGLGAFLQLCHEHGVKVGPWRLQHVVGEWSFGDHPTYGVLSIAHWVCRDGQPWKVG